MLLSISHTCFCAVIYFLFLLNIHLRGELLCYMILSVYLKKCQTILRSFCIIVFLPAMCKCSNVSTSLPTVANMWLFHYSHHSGVKLDLPVVLICIYTMANDVELLSVTLLAICISFSRNVYSDPLATSKDWIICNVTIEF